MTASITLHSIYDLLQTVAQQVGILTVDVATLKEDVSTLKQDVADLKTDVADLKVGLTEVRLELNNKADKADVQIIRDDIASFKQSVNENDAVYSEMLLDHGVRIARLEKARAK